MKVLADTIHGIIDLDDMQTELIAQPELQRLTWLLQLSFTKLVFPGANHSRLEHSIGCSHLARKIADQLELTKDEKRTVIASGLLHDIGHSPLSHILEKFSPVSHEQLASRIITGKEKLHLPSSGQIPSILESHGLNPEKIGAIICGNQKNYLGNIISGDIDADRLDYLLRDAYYTGVSHGNIGIERIIKMLKIKDGKICVLEKGVRSVEEMLLARMQMYPAVYWHHAARIAGLMLAKATSPIIDHIPYFSSLNDFEFIEKLRTLGPFQKETIERLLNRKLYKRAFVATPIELKKYPKIESLLQKPSEIEEKISSSLGIDKNHIIIDARSSAKKVEPLNIPVIRKDGSLIDIKEISSLAGAVYKKESLQPIFSVYTPSENREKVHDFVKNLIQ
jgi:uncharacterized protein